MREDDEGGADIDSGSIRRYARVEATLDQRPLVEFSFSSVDFPLLPNQLLSSSPGLPSPSLPSSTVMLRLTGTALLVLLSQTALAFPSSCPGTAMELLPRYDHSSLGQVAEDVGKTGWATLVAIHGASLPFSSSSSSRP
jgi:hypothetical protein